MKINTLLLLLTTAVVYVALNHYSVGGETLKQTGNLFANGLNEAKSAQSTTW